MARLVPSTPDYPDCMCDLLLTDSFFYVLEDNYDGTHTEHFAIPLRWIVSVEQETYTDKETDGGSGGMSTGQVVATSVVAAIAGLLYLPGGAKRGKPSSVYLAVTWRQGAGCEKLFFAELPGGTGKFLRAYKALAGQERA